MYSGPRAGWGPGPREDVTLVQGSMRPMQGNMGAEFLGSMGS